MSPFTQKYHWKLKKNQECIWLLIFKWASIPSWQWIEIWDYNCCNSIKNLKDVKQVANVRSEQIDIRSDEQAKNDESSCKWDSEYKQQYYAIVGRPKRKD